MTRACEVLLSDLNFIFGEELWVALKPLSMSLTSNGPGLSPFFTFHSLSLGFSCLNCITEVHLPKVLICAIYLFY